MDLTKSAQSPFKSDADATRRKLIEKAVTSLPTKDLKELVSDEADVPRSGLPKPKRMADVAGSVPELKAESGRIVSCRVSFPDLVIERNKERSFLKELTEQLRVALSGFTADAMTCTVMQRQTDEDTAVVQIALPNPRAEQLRSVLESPTLLSYTPLLKFAKFDHVFYSASSNGAAPGSLQYIAPEVLQRLDEMEKRYLDIKDKKNIVESYHEIMKRTNPYELRMEALRKLENPPSLPGLDAPGEPEPKPAFPWSGVSGVLSPRAKSAAPEDPSGSKPILTGYEPSAPLVRAIPPSATVVMAKNAMDTALQQLSVDGVQLSAASAEINRRIEEATENSELARVAAAGLASPQVLEQLVLQNRLKREQQRQRDELGVIKAWEKDELASVERENSMLYMQRLFAMATGDDDAVAALDSGDRQIMNPGAMRDILDAARKEALKNMNASDFVNSRGSRGGKIGITLHVIRGSNLPAQSECFIRLRVLNGRGAAETECQTSTGSGGEWGEGLFSEISGETRKDKNAAIEILLFAYNSLGRDILLSRGVVPMTNVRDTAGQIGVFVLEPVDQSMAGLIATVSLRIDVEEVGGAAAYSRIGAQNIDSLYKQDLQSTQNLMRERNMDFVLDQVERVEEERRRLEGKINQLWGVGNAAAQAAMASAVVPPTTAADYGSFPSPPIVGGGATPVGPSGAAGAATPVPPPGPPLRQVEKPFPTYEILYKELVELVQQGKLGSPDGHQLSYDFSYVGQSKTDFAKDPKLLDYLSLMSDILVQFQSDLPIVVTALASLCAMLTAVAADPTRKRQIALVIYESATRSLPYVEQDPLLADQVLTGLALSLAPPAPTRVTNAHIDFAIAMWERAREPIQAEQVVHVLTFAKSAYRRPDQIGIILAVLERFRFNPSIVNRSLIGLVAIYSTAATVPPSAPTLTGGSAVQIASKPEYPSNGSDIELVVVAAGMYADNVNIQIAAIDALMAIASISSANAERIEYITAPVVIDQTLERNKANPIVQSGVAKLLLKLADLRPKELMLPEAVPCLLNIAGSSISSDTILVALAALRACYTNAKKELIYTIPDALAVQFVSAIEAKSDNDATLSREACVTIEALMASPDIREALVKAGIVAIPIKGLGKHASEYPRMVKLFLSSMHAVILASTRSAYQFARLDGVNLVMNLALFDKNNASDWRAFALLADACQSEEAKNQFNPDDDIERIIGVLEKMGREGTGNTETTLQALRLVGEIAFNSSFSSKELFQKVDSVTKLWYGGGTVAFPFQAVMWGLLNRRFPQRSQSRFDRFTSPNGRELAFQLSDSITRDYNIWVTTQGGNEAGANVAGKQRKEEKEEKTQEKGILDTLNDLLGGEPAEDERRRKRRE